MLGLARVGSLDRFVCARIGLDWLVGLGLACIFVGLLRLAYVAFDRLAWIGLGCSGLACVGLEVGIGLCFLCWFELLRTSSGKLGLALVC